MGNRIKELRKRKGWSQKKLGEKMGVGQTTVSAWETGRNCPSIRQAVRIAIYLGTDLYGLMQEEKHEA